MQLDFEGRDVLHSGGWIGC